MSSLKDRIAASRKAIADQKASYDRAYKFKPGKTVIRLLPGVKDADEFAKEYGAHYIKDPATDAMIAVVGDAQICYGKPCPVREAIGMFIDRCNSRGDDALSEKAKKWLARSTNVANVQIIDGPDTENKGKVVRAEFSQNTFDAILSVLEEYAAVDPEFDAKFRQRGFLLTIERVGTGPTDTRYTPMAYPKQPDNPVPENVLAQRVDLQSVVDGKFGQSVTQALSKLSVLLGKDVTQTALGSAIASTASLAAPQQEQPPVSDFSSSTPAAPSSEDLTSLLGEGPIDAEFTEATATTAAAPTPAPAPAAVEDFDGILAELDNL